MSLSNVLAPQASAMETTTPATSHNWQLRAAIY